MKYQTLAALSLLLVLTLGLSVAHADDPATRGKEGDVLTPMAMGNTWVYEGEEGDDYMTIDRIEGKVLFEGHAWYLLRSYDLEKGQPENTAELVSDNFWITLKDGHEWDAWAQYGEEDGEAEFAVKQLELTARSKYYRYPATLGETYRPSADDPTIVMTVTALNEKVTTKAGEFECVVYKETNTEDEDFSYTSWVAPGVGIIKNTTTDADGTYHSYLASYKLADPE